MGIASSGPCFSAAGRLYIPHGETLRVYDPDGSALPIITTASIGLEGVYWGAWSSAATPQLLLGGSDDGLVAVNPSTLAVQ